MQLQRPRMSVHRGDSTVFLDPPRSIKDLQTYQLAGSSINVVEPRQSMEEKN